MKIIAYILSLVILSLTVVPCMDKTEDNILRKIDITQNTQNHQQDSDHCSPFCACFCCASSITNQANISHLNLIAFSQKLNTEYLLSFASQDFTSIWQPPKLS
jgi:hypothetical protein